MTTLKTIFDKPVDRPIEGVIKADDDASLRLEIEEYVLTNEVAKRLESFLEAYNNYEGANGVWVSGFFGSGKSHLLKMLALLLENRQVEGASALDLFLPKCGDNEMLRGDLKRAVSIPSQSILFNIDQKADVISKSQADALLAVFVKVFDEMCGYYGKQGYIAWFERDLDSRGLYEQFKSAYESTSGNAWEQGREQALLEADNIAAAYATVTGSDKAAVTGILDKYRNEYRVSIEDFAERVQAWIEQQSIRTGRQAFRLNFFVDEVGQYIADNVKLMTNLQTIAESLATKCRGRAWIIVTAQEDMATVVGEMDRQQGNDFSKIQARFANRMKLTSADVAEVIQKRLLTKTEQSTPLLADMYQSQYNNFKTLFDFADGAQSYRNFQDQDHFIRSYPFIPYQFSLFQAAISNLSQHNAFEGKHSSVGERSMLAVFQQVATHIADKETGWLATFDLMFEGIRSALKSNIQRAVIQAENHLDDPFAIRLLKALFLVKYIKEFKATPRNLRILMQEDFGQDVPALRKRIEQALSLLEQQTYVQRSGDEYEYLTDEEKDVEQEIKNTEVESADLAAQLQEIVFDHVIKQNKIRYTENGQDYPFSRRLDENLYGREHELSIHVVSPFHENAQSEDVLRMQSMSRDELLALMPDDDRLVSDLLMYKRTEKYIRQNISITQQETVKRILADKGHQNQNRYTGLKQRVQNLMGKARLIVAGADVESGSGDAQTRIAGAFQDLVSRSYPNLSMLRGAGYTENDVATYLDQTQQGLFSASLAESEQELLASIHRNKGQGLRTTLKSLLEKFERKPYGWYYAAVLCTLAKLCARGKVEVRVDGNLLEHDALEQALRNSRGHGNVVLEPQVDFTASQVRALKEFYEDFFDAPPQASEAKALGEETRDKLRELTQSLDSLSAQIPQYPFLDALTPVLKQLNELAGKSYAWYLTDLGDMRKDLDFMKGQIIDPIRKFMNGSQKTIYDDACQFVRTQMPNFTSLEGDEASHLIATLSDPECYKGNNMQQVKAQTERLKKRIEAEIESEITKAAKNVDNLKNRLLGMNEFSALSEEQQAQLTYPFDEVITGIEKHNVIAVIRDTVRQFEENNYRHVLSRLTTFTQSPAIGNDGANKSGAVTEPEQEIEYIPNSKVQVSFDKAWLANESDVDRYLKSMREALLEEIHKGRRIQI